MENVAENYTKNFSICGKSRIFATSFETRELFEDAEKSRCNSVGRVADL